MDAFIRPRQGAGGESVYVAVGFSDRYIHCVPSGNVHVAQNPQTRVGLQPQAINGSAEGQEGIERLCIVCR